MSWLAVPETFRFCCEFLSTEWTILCDLPPVFRIYGFAWSSLRIRIGPWLVESKAGMLTMKPFRVFVLRIWETYLFILLSPLFFYTIAII